ncbi:hypothetical protein L0B53_03575 [Vibrio sp. SS-MA-C1-2]|uniref:hypothetical protein n=1 Tax=Vibrio sp. SS-MA-C1-2 TaxID=2908646 RepID=UPI001F1EA008|nr:hypothetical protein [Vibrio sp. SS-MA-C1-2]UJF17031.1 hypothetical protein L0B53_03575 [Vibrio sp. SS-MA-C1-2]
MTILLNAGVITEFSYQGVMQAVDTLCKEWGLDQTDEQFNMAMTHLARAVDRIRADDAILEGLDVETMDEILTADYYPLIAEMNKKLSVYFMFDEFPDAENSFLLCNLTSLYQASLNQTSHQNKTEVNYAT